MTKIVDLSTTALLLIIITMSFSLTPSEKVLVVFPNEASTTIYNVYSNIVSLESNFQVSILLNVSSINSESQEIVPIIVNTSFNKSVTIKFNQSGFYLFALSSPLLVQVSFEDSGFKQPLILLAVLIIISKIIIGLWKANFLVINPFSL